MSALESEAAWLNADSTVAALLSPAGVLPYVRAEPAGGARVCWLMRTRTDESRDAMQYKRLTHYLVLRIKWPLETAGANVDQMQVGAEGLVTALRNRIRAVGTDKTHGWAFVVGEAVGGLGQAGVSVAYSDVEQAMKANLPWQIDLSYTAVEASIAG